MRDQIHIGTKPSHEKLNVISNRKASSKPSGGFWTSSYNTQYLSDFVQYERGSLVEPNEEVWKISVSSSANVMVVDSSEKLEGIPSISDHHGKTYIDFETLFEKYDGIHISRSVAHLNSFSDTYNLAGWDLDSVLWNDLSQFTQYEFLGTVSENVDFV